MGHTIQFLIRHGYALLFVWILAEQGAVPLPSIPLLLACGALAHDGKLNLALVLLYGLTACLIADNIWFQLGRKRGGKILRFICRVSLEPDSCVRQTENTFLKYGLRSLLVSKFVPGLNAVAAPLAGNSGEPLSKFAIYDSMGALIWISSYSRLAIYSATSCEIVADHALAPGIVAVLVVVVWRRRGSAGNSSSAADSSASCPYPESLQRNCGT